MIKVSTEHHIVTPKNNFILCGYVPGMIADGVYDNIIMSGLLLSINNKSIYMINIDLCMISEMIREEIIKSLKNDLLNCELLITATHNHTGPSVQGFEHFGILDVEKEQTYREHLGKVALKMYQSLKTKQEECVLNFGSTIIDGLYSSRINITKESDKSIKSIQFVNKNNDVVAQILNIAVHSTILSNKFSKYSADLVGNIAKNLYKENGVYPLIHIGAAGDSSTRFYRINSSENELKRVSKIITNEIQSINHTKNLNIDNLLNKEINYQINTIFDKNTIQKSIKQITNLISMTTDEVYLKLLQSKLFALKFKLKRGYINVNVISNIYKLGDITFITFPLEVDASLVKELYKENHIFLINYANDYHGYIINADDFDNTYEGMSSIFEKNEAEKYISIIKKAL